MLTKKIILKGGYFSMAVLDWWRHLTKEADGKFKNYVNMLVDLQWDPLEMALIEELVTENNFRIGKMVKRQSKYLLPEEVERVRERLADKSTATIRFGNFKDRKASDFCLVGGCYYAGWKKFYLYYRSVELTLEFMFDMILLHQLFTELEMNVKIITMFTPRAFCSSRDGRLAYHKKLRSILEEVDERKKDILMQQKR